MPEAAPQSNDLTAEVELIPPRELMPPTFIEAHKWELGGALVVVLIGVAAWLFLRRRPKAVIQVPPAVVARRELEMLSRNRQVLERASPLPRSNNQTPEKRQRTAALQDAGAPAGAVELEAPRIVRRFLASQLGLATPEFTTAELREAFQKRPGLSAERIAAATTFFQRCDQVKFSPEAAPSDRDVIAEALLVVEHFETVHPEQTSSVAAGVHTQRK